MILRVYPNLQINSIPLPMSCAVSINSCINCYLIYKPFTPKITGESTEISKMTIQIIVLIKIVGRTPFCEPYWLV